MAQNENDRNAGKTNQPGQQGRTTAGNQGSSSDRDKQQDPYMQNQGGTGSDTGNRNLEDTNLDRTTGNISGKDQNEQTQGSVNRSGADRDDEQTRQRGNDTSRTNQDTSSQMQNQNKDKNNPSGL